MSCLKTRLDGRSPDNKSFQIKDKATGAVVAEISLADNAGATINISTAEGLYIEKPNGWNSQK